jgi:prephenate dehydrogenase
MKGPRPTGAVPIGVTAAVGKETRKGLGAKIEIRDRRIASVAFAPTFADEQARPHFLTSDHPMFGETAADVDSISKAVGFSLRFERAGDRVIVG